MCNYKDLKTQIVFKLTECLSVRSLCVLTTLTGTSFPECCKKTNQLLIFFNIITSLHKNGSYLPIRSQIV